VTSSSSQEITDEKFELLMSELRQTHEKFDKSLVEVKQEVATAQEQTAKDLS